MENDKHILIATPAHGYMLSTLYHETILRLLKHFSDRPGVKFDSKMVSIALLPVARNFLASYFIERSEYTHLLFIDADMGFKPSLIAKMLELDEAVVGTFYPARNLDLDRFHAESRRHHDPKVARQRALKFIGDTSWIVGDSKHDGEGQVGVAELKNGFVRARRCGTAILLIQRNALVTMKQRLPELWIEDPGSLYRGLGLSGGVLQCFQNTADASGLYGGEDIAFCDRWTGECNGEIWVNIAEDITHLATAANTGNFLSELNARDEP